MTIMIKDMEMPKNCNECPMSVNGYCVVSPKRANGDALNKYETTLWCPLVEVPIPHGRLIEADKLMDKIRRYDDGELWSEEEVYFTVKGMPTIIEAEE